MVLKGGLAFALVVAVLLATLSPGCLWPSCDRGIAKEWVEPGVFESFPRPGLRNGYEVWWDEPPETIRVRKLAWLASDEDPRVSVTDDDLVRWAFAYDGTDKTDGETGRLLNSTFDALGLSRPKALDWDFSWHQVC